MGRRTTLFWNANKFPFEVTRNYFRFSSKAELIFDFITPLIITVLLMILFYFVHPTTSTVLKGVKDINNQTLTFISILAGFAIASISVLATAGSRLLEDLRSTKSRKIPDKTLFEIMMTFFCASVVNQFLIILIGVIILVVSSIIDIPSTFKINVYCWILLGIWVYMLVTTVFVSVRNLKTLFTIIISENY